MRIKPAWEYKFRWSRRLATVIYITPVVPLYILVTTYLGIREGCTEIKRHWVDWFEIVGEVWNK